MFTNISLVFVMWLVIDFIKEAEACWYIIVIFLCLKAIVILGMLVLNSATMVQTTVAETFLLA